MNDTEHNILIGDARAETVPHNTVDLVVTSPPYPMIEMWDDAFKSMAPSVGEALENSDAATAFDNMHEQLDQVWENLADAVVKGGFVCINIGDATRSVDGDFQVFPNAARITEKFRDLGFHVLPRIYWQKPTNSSTSFMGSGMIPPNAYPKLEHEHILLFRNGSAKTLEPQDNNRYESAYFFEERNSWFSDHWSDITGEDQVLEITGQNDSTRERSAAFPVELPYRLINMFSLYGDMVFDPFAGTGTTTIASMIAGRDSLGIELEEQVAETIRDRSQSIQELSREILTERIDAHQEFVKSRFDAGKDVPYKAEHYPFKVVTQDEQTIRFYEITGISEVPEENSNLSWSQVENHLSFRVSYEPYDQGVPTSLDRYVQADSTQFTD